MKDSGHFTARWTNGLKSKEIHGVWSTLESAKSDAKLFLQKFTTIAAVTIYDGMGHIAFTITRWEI